MSKARESDHRFVNCEGECLSFRIQDHGIGISFVGLASLLGRAGRGSTSGPSKVPSKVLRDLSHSDIDRKR